MSRTLVMGDVHGGARALDQVLERSEFSSDDRLIFLGDVADGWPETRRCVDILLGIPNCISLIGNHDVWFRNWLAGTFDIFDRQLWLGQGGYSTLRSYGVVFESPPEEVPDAHREFFVDTLQLYHEEDGRLFVHAGFIPSYPIEEQDEFVLTWDRDLWRNARNWELRAKARGQEDIEPYVEAYDEVFVGHTTVTPYGKDEPTRYSNVWNMDTGAGWEGRLSVMDIDTNEVWQSDPVCVLYPESAGRRG